MEPGARLPHWAGLDGLRGLAVAAVLAFHGGLSWARGGFLGVSLFFTLSGFLITSIVVHERATTGRVSLTRFWARRARRLLPASIVALGLAMAVAVVVIPSAQQAEAFGDVRAAALNLANWRFIWRGDVYADVTRLPSPVQHYWSLAIEEQFYLVFPLLALVVLRWRRAVLATVFAVVIAWSLRQQLILDDQSRVYFGTDARAAELAVGGLLALARTRITGLVGPGSARRAADVLGAAGLAATAVLWWRVPNTSESLHGGGLVAVGVVSAMVVFGAVEGDRLPRLLSARLLTWLGLISYGVYLFHYPLFLALDAPRVPVEGAALFVLRVAASVGVAAASFALLERPVRRGTLLQGHRSTAAFAGSLAVLVVATVIAAQRYDGPRSTELAGGIDVSLAAALEPTASDVRAPHVVLVGDSTAATMGRGLEPWGRATGRLRVTTVASPGCATLSGARLRVREGYDFVPKGCDELFTTAARIADEQSADAIVVLIGSSQLGDWTYAGAPGWRDISDEQIQRAYRERLDEVLAQLSAAGVPILWADLPTPDWDLDKFGELLGGPLPGGGPVVVNDPSRAAIVNRIDAATVPGHALASIWPWTEVLSGPSGRIPDGLRFDGLHVDEARVPELAEGGLLPALEAAYDAVVARAPTGLHPTAEHLWSVPRTSPAVSSSG